MVPVIRRAELRDGRRLTPAELVAGVQAIQHRVDTGRWDDVATPWALQGAGIALGLGEAAFIPFEPGPLTGENG